MLRRDINFVLVKRVLRATYRQATFVILSCGPLFTVTYPYIVLYVMHLHFSNSRVSYPNYWVVVYRCYNSARSRYGDSPVINDDTNSVAEQTNKRVSAAIKSPFQLARTRFELRPYNTNIITGVIPSIHTTIPLHIIPVFRKRIQ